MLVVVVFVVVLVFTPICFRSVLIPLRLLLTIAVTMTWVSGLTVFVFQKVLGFDGIYW